MRIPDKRSATGASFDRMRPNECEIDENKRKRLKKQCIGLATKWLRIFSLDGNDQIRNHLVANPIQNSENHAVINNRFPLKIPQFLNLPKNKVFGSKSNKDTLLYFTIHESSHTSALIACLIANYLFVSRSPLQFYSAYVLYHNKRYFPLIMLNYLAINELCK